MNKIWHKQDVIDLIKDPQTTSQTLGVLLFCLFKRQTASEQSSEYTSDKNGRGFNSHDAQFLSSIAKNSERFSYCLTPRMAACVRKSMVKYAGQLADALNSGETTLEPSFTAPVRQNSRQTPVSTPIQPSKTSKSAPAPQPPAPSDDEWQSLLQESEKVGSEL